jgi:hypothetical protein
VRLVEASAGPDAPVEALDNRWQDAQICPGFTLSRRLAMKRMFVTASALAAFSLIPLTAGACGAYDEAMATATPPAALASAPPAASKLPPATVAKAPLKVTKHVVNKTDVRATDAKVATITAN